MRLYAWLLYLYPPSFRRAYGAAMQQLLRTVEQREPRRRFNLAADLGRSLAREWFEALRPARVRARAAAPGRPPSGESMRNIIRDFALAVRLLAKSPAFTAAAVLTLALGIGANTAMFTLADATLLRPLQIHDPDRLVVWSWSSSYPHYQEYAARRDIFDGVLAVGGTSRLNLVIDGTAELARGVFLSGNAFEVLGVQAAHGRTLLPSDDVPNGPVVAVLGHDYWRRRFGGEASVVGRGIRVNGVPVTIVGVADPTFRGTSVGANPALYMPAAITRQVRTGFLSRIDPITSRGFVWLTVVGRLKPGVAVAQAEEAMGALYEKLQPLRPGARREPLRLEPLQTRALGGSAASIRRFVMLLVGVVALTLLVGCANLANLLLARAAGRRREMGVRLALGATRRRVVQQLLVESVLLAAIGGAAGLGVAALALALLGAYELPGGVNIGNLDLSINGAALAAASALSLLTGLLFGAMPAWRASRTDVLVSLRDQSRGATARSPLQSLLLATQVAVSLVLLAGTGLFARSLAAALDRSPGFDPAGVVTASVNLGLARYEAGRARTFYAEALDRIRGLPQVQSAAWSSLVPTRGLMMGDAEVEGYAKAADESITVYASHAGADYFRTVGTRLRAGREFGPGDVPGAPLVGIINETMARKYWAGRDPIGGRFKMFGTEWLTVVGVADNVVVRELQENPVPQVYLAFPQWLAGQEGIGVDAAHLLVRTRSNASAAIPIIRDRLRALDPELPLYDIELLDERVQALVLPQRMGVVLFGLFSALALALATVGIYGVATYVASMRTREIGIRMALGANARAVRRLILTQGALPVAGGILAGLALALYASRLATTFLFGIGPFDVVAFAAATMILSLVALGATYLPARRAGRVDPVTALRHE